MSTVAWSLPLFLCTVAFAFGCSRAEAKPDGPMRVEGAVARVLPSGAGVIYMRVINDGAVDDRLERVDVPGAADAQLHEVVYSGDLSTMRPASNGFALAGHTTLSLQHDGKHVMLFGVKQPATIAALQVVLRFEHSAPLTISVPIEPREH